MDAKLRARARSALDEIADAAQRAGEIAMRDFRFGAATSAEVRTKHGGSPVTAADLAVDRYLRERLRAAYPDAGWLSEETADDAERLDKASLLVVDPIDGTRAFLAGDPRWTVSIAFCLDGRPIAGAVHAPALGETYVAAVGCGARLNGAPVHASRRPALAGALVGGPKSMVAALAKAAGVEFAAAPRIPSLALRLARVAGGALDIGLASANAHDWDVAAADVVLSEAGAALTDADGQMLRYNTQKTRHGALLACGASLAPALATAARLARAEPSA
ncbi:MAG: 3'(2'),5'-bisphosphate nucleotidase CysQ [Roseiarcus sp.]|jgi:myo-inositol-1(or 4)-monophosphatase